MQKIRVFLADDQNLIREGIKYILDVQGDLEVVGDASDGQTAVEGIAKARPDVVLMDIRMPGMDGIEATRIAIASNPDLKVIVLTTFNQLDHVIDAIRAGAVGFLLKDAEAAEIIEGIRAAHRGEAFFRTEYAGLAMNTAFRPGIEGDVAELGQIGIAGRTQVPIEVMTERELEVLQEMAYGRRNSEIAQRLHVTEGTVKSHIHHILDKMGVSDRTQAVILALRGGLVQ